MLDGSRSDDAYSWRKKVARAFFATAERLWWIPIAVWILFLLLVLFVLINMFACRAAAQSIAARSLIVQAVDRNRTAVVSGAVNPETAHAQDLGAVDPAQVLEHMQLLLRRPPERQAAFDAFVEAQQQKGSPSYHQWLTPEQIGAEFGPSESDRATVVRFLQAEGFTVTGQGKAGLYIDFRGTASQVLYTFHTVVHNYRMPTGDVRYSASQAANLPEALTGVVVGFIRLSNIQPHPQLGRGKPQDLIGSEQEVGPQDFYAIYNETPALSTYTGSGQTIALVEQSDINTADVTSFRTIFGVTPNTPGSLTVQHGGCSDPGNIGGINEAEGVLDAEWAGAVAPSAALLYLSCSSADVASEYAVDANVASIISVSYGTTEQGNATEGSFLSGLWEQASAQGQTVLVATGDRGSDVTDVSTANAYSGLSVSVYASTPYDIAVGATDFQDRYNYLTDDNSYGPSTFWNNSNGTGAVTAKGYVPETTWNGTCASSLWNAYEGGSFNTPPLALCESSYGQTYFFGREAGGGGASILFSRPSWQTGTVYGLPSASSVPNRVLPDVSLFGSDGVWGHSDLYYQSDESSSPMGIGGTSVTAPMMAGVVALLAQKSGGRIGLIGQQLYALAGTAYGISSFTGSGCNGSGASGVANTSSLPSASCVFYDIQTGNNSEPCVAGSTNCFSDSGQAYGLLSTSTTSAQPAYPATAGWDYATGIGSMNIANLVNSWIPPAQAATLTIVPVPNPYVYGSTQYPTIQVSGTNTVSPTGTVSYYVNSGSVGTYTLSGNGCVNGTCTSSASSGDYFSSTRVVGYSFTVNSTFTSSSGYYSSGATATATITVVKQTPTVTASSLSFDTGTSTVSLTATVTYTGSGSAPSGGLTFKIDSGTSVTAICTGSSSPRICTYNGYNVSALASGTHTLTATANSDTNYNAASGTANILIVTPTQPFIGWLPLGNSRYEEVPLGTNILDAVGSVPGNITYKATLLPSGVPAVVTASNGLAVGSYILTATLTPTDSLDYTTATATIPLTVTLQSIFLTAGGSVLSLYDSGSVRSAAVSPGGGIGAAVDSAGNVWSLSTDGSTLVKISDAGAPVMTYTGGGINTATALALDGGGQIWIANSNGSLSVLTTAGTAVSPSTGYADNSISGPSGIAVDVSGNVWVANANSSTVDEVIGGAVPVEPLSTAVVNNTPGSKP